MTLTFKLHFATFNHNPNKIYICYISNCKKKNYIHEYDCMFFMHYIIKLIRD